MHSQDAKDIELTYNPAEPKPDPFQGRRFKCSASIQQKDFNTPALEPWQRGNTKRYDSLRCWIKCAVIIEICGCYVRYVVA